MGPTLLVSLGLGSVVASIFSILPFLVFISKHKSWFFLGTALTLSLNYLFVFYLPARRQCREGKICHIGSTVSRVNRWIFWISVGLYLVALSATYLILPVMKLLGG